MRRTIAAAGLVAAALFIARVPAGGPDQQPRYAKRWVYVQCNLQTDAGLKLVLGLIERAARAGYNALVLADYKFNILGRVPAHYFKNVAAVRKAAAATGVELIPTVCPVGYSGGLLAHDPNLAEGLPVKDALFVARGGLLLPVADPPVKVRNGDLEEVKGDRFVGFTLQDEPGTSTVPDRAVKYTGKVSCRMQDFRRQGAGNCRLAQRVAVRPHACYKLSCWVKTKDLQPAGGFRLLALGAAKGGPTLSYFDDPVKPTQDWARVEVAFNSLDQTEVNLYAGVWGGRSGTLWVDDIQVEEVFLTNVLRRPGCPLTVTAADGQAAYEEGKDFEPVRDPKLGRAPWDGEFEFRHPAPPIKLTEPSRIKEGAKVRVGWYHPVLTHSFQVMCCLSEPKVYDLLRDQVKRVDDLLKPKTFFLAHDEIRVANWCRACQDRKQTPGQLLADNVRRCVKMVKEVSPQAEVIVWSDMFDPNHNAVDRYYLVNGPLTGSWEGLPARVAVANWNGGKAAASLKFFAGRGHEQVIAGYYDHDDPAAFRRWDAAAKGVPRVRGFMYTTWQGRYDQLEAYGKLLRGAD